MTAVCPLARRAKGNLSSQARTRTVALARRLVSGMLARSLVSRACWHPADNNWAGGPGVLGWLAVTKYSSAVGVPVSVILSHQASGELANKRPLHIA